MDFMDIEETKNEICEDDEIEILDSPSPSSPVSSILSVGIGSNTEKDLKEISKDNSQNSPDMIIKKNSTPLSHEIKSASNNLPKKNKIYDKEPTFKSRSWADIVDEEERQQRLIKKKRKLKKKRFQQRKLLLEKLNPEEERDREIFIGNLRYEELNDLNVNTTNKYKIRNQRREAFIEMFNQYFVDQIERIRPYWTRGFVYILFKTPEIAQTALELLHSFEFRKKLCANMKTWVKEKQYFKSAVPPPSFYVRWTKNFNLLTEVVNKNSTSN